MPEQTVIDPRGRGEKPSRHHPQSQLGTGCSLLQGKASLCQCGVVGGRPLAPPPMKMAASGLRRCLLADATITYRINEDKASSVLIVFPESHEPGLFDLVQQLFNQLLLLFYLLLLCFHLFFQRFGLFLLFLYSFHKRNDELGVREVIG